MISWLKSVSYTHLDVYKRQVITHVTECHHLYVNSCTPGIRDIVVTTIYVRTWVVPGTEYGLSLIHIFP